MEKLTVTQVKNNFRQYFEAAYTAEYQNGVTWYHRANEWCELIGEEYGIGTNAVAYVTAILSPQTDWKRNMLCTVAILTGDVDTAYKHQYGINIDKALTFLTFGTLTLKAKKVTAFHRNLMLDPDAVTVDTWIFRAGWNDLKLQTRHGSPIRRLTTSTRIAKKALHELSNEYGIEAYKIQAVIWNVVRRVAGYPLYA